jgi:hypothetical protein
MKLKIGDIIRVKSDIKGVYDVIKVGTIGSVCRLPIQDTDEITYICIKIINCPTYRNYNKDKIFEVYTRDIELMGLVN